MSPPDLIEDTDATHALCMLVLSLQMGKLTDAELIRQARIIYSSGALAGGRFVLSGEQQAPALKVCK